MAFAPHVRDDGIYLKELASHGRDAAIQTEWTLASVLTFEDTKASTRGSACLMYHLPASDPCCRVIKSQDLGPQIHK